MGAWRIWKFEILLSVMLHSMKLKESVSAAETGRRNPGRSDPGIVLQLQDVQHNFTTRRYKNLSEPYICDAGLIL